MASESVATTPKSCRLLKLGVEYLIPSDSNPHDLLDDASCLLACAETLVQCMIDGLHDEGSNMNVSPREAASMLYSLRYQLEMIRSMAEAANTISLRAA
ncbi:MAG: hypothetical protein JSR34_09195 [Proteobacteria bacterium]|nr:hypothetical protein [Pseudomonadota bacterium]